MKRFLVFVSTVSFNEYVEFATAVVFGANAAEAERSARAQGYDTMLGFKFQRVEEILERDTVSA